METSVKLHGLEASLKALEAAFPNDQKIRTQIINGSIGQAARKTMLPVAKQLAAQGDESGALSESLAVRTMSKRQRGPRPWGMVLTPVRSNKKAMAMYIQHYYTARGKNPTGKLVIDGIRHGHLIEFGFDHTSGVHFSARSFLWAAGEMKSEQYRIEFAKQLKRRTEARVRREAKKGRGDAYYGRKT